MKISPELIEKYFLETCSAEEQKAVEQWLSNNTDEDSNLSNSTLEKMQSNIWNSFSKSRSPNTTKVIPIYKKITRYAAAACITIGLVLTATQIFKTYGYMNSKMAFNNTSNTKQIQKSGIIDFTLMPNSKMDVVTNLSKTKSDIVFCGDVELVNKMNDDVQFEIRTSCEMSVGVKRKVTLKKDVHYYLFALKDKQGKEKIHIYNKEDLLLFFPPSRVPKHILKAIMG